MLNNVSLHGSARGAPHQWAIGHAFVCSQLNIIEFHIAVCQYPVQCILYSNNDANFGGERFFFNIWDLGTAPSMPQFPHYTCQHAFVFKYSFFFTFVSLILWYEKQNTLGKD